MTSDRPKCPNHPNSSVIDAKVAGTPRRYWVCLTCFEKLGDAPEREAEWERFDYTKDDVNDIED